MNHFQSTTPAATPAHGAVPVRIAGPSMRRKIILIGRVSVIALTSIMLPYSFGGHGKLVGFDAAWAENADSDSDGIPDGTDTDDNSADAPDNAQSADNSDDPSDGGGTDSANGAENDQSDNNDDQGDDNDDQGEDDHSDHAGAGASGVGGGGAGGDHDGGDHDGGGHDGGGGGGDD